MTPTTYASISGGGPAITYLAGGAAALDVRCRVVGWSGASAGELAARGWGACPDPEVTSE